MGQFSWVCGLCDQEVMHGRQPGYQWTTDAVILWPNGDRRSGRYEDGYGRIAGIDLVDQHGGWRLVHQHCLEKIKCLNLGHDRLWLSLNKDRHASDQGWWPGEREAVERYGEPDHSELTESKTYVCYSCKRTWEATWSGGLCQFGCIRPKNYGMPEEDIAEGWGDHREMVEYFHYINYVLGNADGVVICHNEHVERPDWTARRAEGGDPEAMKVEPCFRFGEAQQARLSKPEEWDGFEREERGEFVVRCRSCNTDRVEIVSLNAM